jgi:hypothetical protein
VRRALGALLLAGLFTAMPSRVSAGEPPRLAEGRGFTWGASATVPILVGDVRYTRRDGTVPYFAAGGGVMGRVGVELAGGLALEVVAGAHVHAVESEPVLVVYRGGAQLRYTFATGSDVVPFLGGGGSFLLLSRDKALQATGGVHAVFGVGWCVADWASLELAIEGDVAFPGDALQDTIFWLAPMIGATIFY